MSDGGTRVRACAAGDLGDGEILRVDIVGRPPVALFRIGGEFFATDDTCTHGAASLADGFVEGGEVECPFHGGRFDIRTGQATLHPCVHPLRTFAVEVEADEVFVDITEPSRAALAGGA